MTDDNPLYTPKYVQIQSFILRKIESGEFPIGGRIPPEIELARQFGVSRLTVNTAMKELAGSGIVERVQGRGTFVRTVPGKAPGRPMVFAGGIKIAPFQHLSKKSHALLEHGIVKADPSLREKLPLGPEEYVYRIVRCVYADSKPDALDYSYIPLSICKNHTFDREALKTYYLHEYFCQYFEQKPTHVRIFVDTALQRDMDISLLKAPREELFCWDTFLYQEDRALAFTTTVSLPQRNRPFITFAL